MNPSRLHAHCLSSAEREALASAIILAADERQDRAVVATHIVPDRYIYERPDGVERRPDGECE